MPTTPPPSSSGSRAEDAVRALAVCLAAPASDGPSAGTWRFKVRGRVAALREVLIELPGAEGDGWLSARGGSSFAERNALLGRLGALTREVLEEPDLEVARRTAATVLDDVVAHLRRVGAPTSASAVPPTTAPDPTADA